ncbi:hypothetical protein HYT57_00295 [Candidatus Woesearchaeota archaeon]|nr:hypothetical protein [Candidatus Woesearchaeota archaeon]
MVDKKYLFLSGVIIVFIALLVVTLIFSPKIIKPVDKEDLPKTCEGQCNGVVSCLEQCANVKSNLATLNEDVTACDEIQDPLKAEECRRNVGLKKAIVAEDSSQCIDENCRNAVLLSKAISTKDKILCEQITIEAMKSDCLKLV